METLLTVAQVLALLSAAALCVYLIVVLVRLRGVLTVVEKDLSDLNLHLKPVLENLEFITARFKSVATAIDEHVSVTRGSLESVKQVVDNILDFERRVQQILEEPIMRVSSLISAVIERLISRFGRSTSE